MDMRKSPMRHPQGEPLTVLGASLWSTVCVYTGFVLAGVGVGWLVGLLADWLITLPWAPLQGPAELVVWLPVPVLPAAGSVAGLALGLVAQYEQLVIHLSGERVVLRRKGREQEFPSRTIAAVFLDGKRLVLLGHGGGELTRQECDLAAGRVADAFTEYDYTWADADPYKDEFRRWVPDASGLPEGANAILKARQMSLGEKGSSDDDVEQLREELARLGVVVRDEKRRQYWRRVNREPRPAVE
ncbi:YqeB family protein [Streptomyces sp. QTS137]